MSIVSRMFLGPRGSARARSSGPIRALHRSRSPPLIGNGWRCCTRSTTTKNRRIDGQVRLEQELLWPTIWIEEVLPRIWTAFLLRKDVLMGLVTPMNVEIVRRFLSAFPGQASVFLPPEGRHFLQAWNHVGQRPRTWGSGFDGVAEYALDPAFAAGLAADLGLPAVPAPKIGRALPSRVRARRRVSGGSQGTCLHRGGSWTMDQKWTRGADRRPAPSVSRRGRRNPSALRSFLPGLRKGAARLRRASGLVRRCRRAAACGLDRDGQDRPLEEGKRRPSCFVGTLAPFHHGHLEALDAAKRHLETRRWQVVGGYASAFTEIRPGRAGTLDAVLGPGERRSLMLQLGVSGSGWLMADASVDRVLDAASLAGGASGPTDRRAAARPGRAFADDAVVTTFGSMEKMPCSSRSSSRRSRRRPMRIRGNPLRMLVVDNRPGEDGWSRSGSQPGSGIGTRGAALPLSFQVSDERHGGPSGPRFGGPRRPREPWPCRWSRPISGTDVRRNHRILDG